MSASPPVVLTIHSTGTLPSMWSRLLAAVPLRAEVRSPAHLGYPPHPPLERGTRVGWADDVAVLRAAIADAETVHLVGHSYGGMLALRLARQLAAADGPRVASLWLYEPVTFGALRREMATLDEETHAQMVWLFEQSGLLDDDTVGGTERWLRTFVDFWNRPGAWDGMPEAARAPMRPLGWKMYQEVRAINLDGDGFEAFAVDAPLTLVGGARSPLAAQALLKRLADANPQARRVAVDGVAHMAPLTQPQALVASFRDHFADLVG